MRLLLLEMQGAHFELVSMKNKDILPPLLLVSITSCFVASTLCCQITANNQLVRSEKDLSTKA